MPEHCPICDTELEHGYWCPKCRASMRARKLEDRVRMLEGAIEGWRRTSGELKAENELLQGHLAQIRKARDWHKQLCGEPDRDVDAINDAMLALNLTMDFVFATDEYKEAPDALAT